MFLTSFINPKNTVSFLFLCFLGGGFYPGGSQSRSRFARRLGIRVGVPERSAAPVSPETRKVKKSSKNHRQAGAGLLLLVLPDEKTGKREEREKKKRLLYTSLVISLCRVSTVCAEELRTVRGCRGNLGQFRPLFQRTPRRCAWGPR
ncbi:hypothetical protein CHARACLAT_003782 [Characodon lateralis]|uniref:Secreted protein n=1 Tax=Characodon lateralis TaxID=208331 RepID=A0ABU7F096_9TELE|nr:hypothetical protein [Characodon lateralis]